MKCVRLISAVTLLVGRQKGIRPVKNLSNGVLICFLSGTRCKWFAYGPADATATPLSLASLQTRMVLPFWCWLTHVFLEKRPLNGGSSNMLMMLGLWLIQQLCCKTE